MLHAGTSVFAPTLEIAPDRQVSLGRRLVEDGMLAPWQLFYAVACINKWDCALSDVLIRKGWATEAQLLPHLSKHYFAQVVNLDQAPPDARLATLLSPQFCIRHAVIPWISMNGQVAFVTSRPHAFEALKKSLPIGPNGLRMVLAEETQIQNYLRKRHHDLLTRDCATRVAEQESCRNWGGKIHQRIAITGVIALVLGLLGIL